MSIEVIQPENEQHWLECRTKDITSTEVAALFGLSPYITEFELWHRKKQGVVVKFEATKRMKWGTALQDAIAAEIAREKGWTVRRMNEYIRNPEERAGSSFDFSIEETFLDGAVDRCFDDLVEKGVISEEQNRPKCCGLLEIKNVDSLQFRDGWIVHEDGQIEAPLHIEIQVQHQLMVSGRTFCHIGALVGGNDLKMIYREPNKKIFASIRSKIAAFWASIDANQPPKPNFAQDAAFISKLYGYADPGKIMNLSGNDLILAKAQEYKRLGDAEKKAKEERAAIKAELLTIIGDAEKAEGDGFKISASMVSGGPVSYVREGYRDFRITWAKVKG